MRPLNGDGGITACFNYVFEINFEIKFRRHDKYYVERLFHQYGKT